MARTKLQIEATKRILRTNFEKIVEASEVISIEMANLPHQRGMAHQSLCAKTGEYVVQVKNSFTADYIDSKGQRYRIQVARQD